MCVAHQPPNEESFSPGDIEQVQVTKKADAWVVLMTTNNVTTGIS